MGDEKKRKVSDGRKKGTDERADCEREMTDEKKNLGDGNFIKEIE